jgi:hypothetical protein
MGADPGGYRGVTGMQIAQMNVATALYDLDHPGMSDFMGNLDRINALAEASPGFVWRLKGEGNDATDLKVSDDPRFIVNMSVWESIEALFDFAYRSDHRAVMVRRREWFARSAGPYQVLWWIEPGVYPLVEDGLARLRHLAEHGPTPWAFTFKTVFPPGDAAPVDLEPEPYCVGWA